MADDDQRSGYEQLKNDYLRVQVGRARAQLAAATAQADAKAELSKEFAELDRLHDQLTSKDQDVLGTAINEAKQRLQVEESRTWEAAADLLEHDVPVGSSDWWWKKIPELRRFHRWFMYLFKLRPRPKALLRSWTASESTPSEEQLLAFMRHNDTIYIATSAAILIFTSALGGQVVGRVFESGDNQVVPYSVLYVTSHIFLFVPAFILLLLLCAQGYHNYFQREFRLAVLYQHYRVSNLVIDPRTNRYCASAVLFGLSAVCWALLAGFKVYGDVQERDLSRAETSRAAAAEPP